MPLRQMTPVMWSMLCPVSAIDRMAAKCFDQSADKISMGPKAPLIGLDGMFVWPVT